MASDSEHEVPVAVTAGSGLEAVRLLKPINVVSTPLCWRAKPSVVTWQHSLPMRLSAVPSPKEKVESDVQLGMKMHDRVPPWMWCVDEHAFDRFLAVVRHAHANDMIKNDADPITGLPNKFHDNPQVGPNMHVVNKYVIKAKTHSAGGMSWALMERPEGQMISFFVTHSWKEGVYEFYRKVRYNWPSGMSMWCCFLANPQSWQASELKRLLGQKDDLSDSPFMQALAAPCIQRFLVVPNCSESLYRRLWCVAELKTAMEIEIGMGRPFIFVAKDPLEKSYGPRRVESVASMISEAKCSDIDDEIRIRKFIQGHEENIERMIVQIAKGRREMGSAAMSNVLSPRPPSVSRRYSDMGDKVSRIRASALGLAQEAKFSQVRSESAIDLGAMEVTKGPISKVSWIKQKVGGLWSSRAKYSRAKQTEKDKHDVARPRGKRSKKQERTSGLDSVEDADTSDRESIASHSSRAEAEDDILSECDLWNI